MKTGYDSHTDVELVRLLQGGSHAAFTTIYNRYWDRLFYLAGKRLANMMDAEEVVQEIFLDLWRRREELRLTAELQHYLAVAVKYRVLNRLASERRAQIHAAQTAMTMHAIDQSPEEWLDQMQLEERLSGVVAALPEKCRLAFRLREAGFSQREIASRMQVSENTVKTHIGKALRHLRAALGLLFFLLFSIGR